MSNLLLRLAPVAGILASFVIAIGACSSTNDLPAVSNTPDSGRKENEPGSNPPPDPGPKPDPDPRPIDEKPKPQEPDKAAVPVLGSIAPEKAFVGGVGPTIIVTGRSFVPRSVVQLEGAAIPTSFTSATELRATVPTTSLANVARLKVTVTTPAPGGGTSSDVIFAIENPKPEVTGLAPLSILAGAANTPFVVTGTGFVAGSKIRFGTTELDTKVTSDTKLETTIPSTLLTTSASIAVKVVNPIPGGGTSTDLAFTISNPSVTVTSLSPDRGDIAGAAFTLSVKGTGYTPTSQIVFNSVALPTTYVAIDTLSATIPANFLTAPGALPVAVQSPPPGGGLSNAVPFNIAYPIPIVGSLEPPRAAAGSGPTEVTVIGSKFFSTSYITFNDARAATTFVDDKKLKATLDASQLAAIGIIKVRVVNPEPGGGPSADPPKEFSVENGRPDMTSILPSGIPMGSDDTVMTIFGTGFLPTTQARIKGSMLLPTTYIDGGKLTTIIPKAELTTGGMTFSVNVVNPPPGGGTAVNFQRATVLCDSTGVNVLVEKNTQPLTLDFSTFPKVPRWPATGGTCPLSTIPVDQPAFYAVVQNVTTDFLYMSAYAVCPEGGKGDAFLATYATGKVPTTADERKACKGVVSEGGSNKSPESGGSNFCPGFKKDPVSGAGTAIQLKACERAIVQIQTLKFEDPANYAAPTQLKVKGE